MEQVNASIVKLPAETVYLNRKVVIEDDGGMRFETPEIDADAAWIGAGEIVTVVVDMDRQIRARVDFIEGAELGRAGRVVHLEPVEADGAEGEKD